MNSVSDAGLRLGQTRVVGRCHAGPRSNVSIGCATVCCEATWSSSRLTYRGEKQNRATTRAFSYAQMSDFELLRAVDRAISEVIPQDPSRAEYRQGNTLGRGYRHWRRARIGRRFRLFFRYDTRAKVIVHAWMNDERTLRSAGSKTDPHTVFAGMLSQGNPANDWAAWIAASRQKPKPGM